MEGENLKSWVGLKCVYNPLNGLGQRDKDGCTPNSVPMVFIVFSSDSWGLYPINIHYKAYIGISNRGTLGSGYVQLSPDW